MFRLISVFRRFKTLPFLRSAKPGNSIAVVQVAEQSGNSERDFRQWILPKAIIAGIVIFTAICSGDKKVCQAKEPAENDTNTTRLLESLLREMAEKGGSLEMVRQIPANMKEEFRVKAVGRYFTNLVACMYYNTGDKRKAASYWALNAVLIYLLDGDGKAREFISLFESKDSDLAQEVSSEYEKALKSIQNDSQSDIQPHPTPDVSKTMHIFEHWLAMRSVETLVDFYRTQEDGRLYKTQELAKEWARLAIHDGLKSLGIRKKFVTHGTISLLSVAASIEYMIEGDQMARKFIKEHSRGDLDLTGKRLEKQIISLYEKDKVLIDAAMGWSKTESSPVSETNLLIQ